MSTMRLPDFPFRFHYGADDDRLYEFYLPALERSSRYDRATGFFSSGALAVAAAGIVRLVSNGGTMRLLCGAELSREDVEAVRRGAELPDVVGRAMAGCLADPKDASLRARLEALAWMVAAGKLDIRVVLPRDRNGHPLPAAEAEEYYHPKEGLFTDADGNQLAFSGSSNESESGWVRNYETFMVFTTWPRNVDGEEIPHGRAHVRSVAARFDRLWDGRDDSWIALDIPRAAREKLLSFAPTEAPLADSLERRRVDAGSTPPADLHERLVFLFLREAPFLPNADRLGVETSLVRPWPHQARLVRELVDSFPRRWLLCDEVGLGKTIEAGLALRQLVVSGRARRVLLLAPKSVTRQWQEELREKLALDVPRYEGGMLVDAQGSERPVDARDAWNDVPVLIASSQLAKRRDRQREILEAEPWDLVIVDEAHHARRRDFLDERYRPNRLLELLAGTGGRAGLRDRTRGLWLLTATPMQVHAVEVWDLLRLLGMGGRWAASSADFLRFFAEMRAPFAERDWAFLLAMTSDHVRLEGLDPVIAPELERRLGPVRWRTVMSLVEGGDGRPAVSRLDNETRAALDSLVRSHTPLRTFLRRNTRHLLRRYRDAGILKERIPDRQPVNCWIPLRDDEQELYDRIEEYISDFYRRYEAERRGLGFVMTVYRRRLTSSFFAIKRSLERRLAWLDGQLGDGWLQDDDLEEEALEADVDTLLEEEDRRETFAGERAYVEDFIHEIDRLGTDSKLDRLMEEVRRVFSERETLLVFTQYTDTMDYLRDRLRAVWGSQVACWSGRGGEVWDGAAWVPRRKEALKDEFRAGESVRILLCTESASEGLNLQTCGVLVNWDMPWNPMRVEQRIGRIDRIGQRHDEVWVRNFFYEDTVEATVYQRLADRIGWFEGVVGPLQPILHRVSQVIADAAMVTGDERQRLLDAQIRSLRDDLERVQQEALDLDGWVDQTVAPESGVTPPVSLDELEAKLIGSELLGSLFSEHHAIPGAFELDWRGRRRAVTFRPAVYDLHPDHLDLLSYGSTLLDELLGAVAAPPAADDLAAAALVRSPGALRTSAFFASNDVDGPRSLGTLREFEVAAVSGAPASAFPPEALIRAFESAFACRREVEDGADARLRQGELLALQHEAGAILRRRALLEWAGNVAPGDRPIDSGPIDLSPALRGILARNEVPWPGLAKVAGAVVLELDREDRDVPEATQMGREARAKEVAQLRERGTDVLRFYRRIGTEAARTVTVSAPQVMLLPPSAPPA